MAGFRMNRFSSIETSSHVASVSEFEVLEWPRPIDATPLTHVAIKLDANKGVLSPVLIGEYENFHQSKGKFDLWTNLLGVEDHKICEIIQATTALVAVIKKFGYKTNLRSLENWANSLEENWPASGPSENIGPFNQKLLTTKNVEKITPELGIFWLKGANSLKFRINTEIKIFTKFLNRRTLYDNLASITRICWMARKEMGMWSRTRLDKLIILTEQTLNFRLYSRYTSKNLPHQIISDIEPWLKYMFTINSQANDSSNIEIINARSEKLIIKIKSLLNSPEKDSDTDVSTDEENDTVKYKNFRKTTFRQKTRTTPWRKLSNAKNYVLIIEK